MAEYVAVAAQEVAANGNVVYTNTAVKGTACVQHREGSGIVTLLISARPAILWTFLQILQCRPEEPREKFLLLLQSAENLSYLLG